MWNPLVVARSYICPIPEYTWHIHVKKTEAVSYTSQYGPMLRSIGLSHDVTFFSPIIREYPYRSTAIEHFTVCMLELSVTWEYLFFCSCLDFLTRNVIEIRTPRIQGWALSDALSISYVSQVYAILNLRLKKYAEFYMFWVETFFFWVK